MSVCNDSTAAFKRLLGFFLPKSLLGYGEYGVDDDTSDGGLSKALLERGDDKTSNTIIGEFAEDAAFATLAKREMEQILARDAEDGEKLAAGIAMAVQRGVLPANPPVEPVTKIDVAGKSADTVANEIVAALGDAPKKGCVLVLQGLSGTGKGTTVAKLEQKLARAVCWSNGNVFRSLTLLAVSYCGAQGVEFAPKVFTKKVLGKLMDCLKFDKWDGKWDILIDGFGHELLVSKVRHPAARCLHGTRMHTRPPRCLFKRLGPSGCALVPGGEHDAQRAARREEHPVDREADAGRGRPVRRRRCRQDGRRRHERAHGGPIADARLRAHAAPL